MRNALDNDVGRDEKGKDHFQRAQFYRGDEVEITSQEVYFNEASYKDPAYGAVRGRRGKQCLVSHSIIFLV